MSGRLPLREAEISMEDYRLLRDAIQRFCGITFGDDARGMVARRLEDRVKALGLSDFAQYHRYVRFHPGARAELEEVADILTTNETYFMREEYQLRAFVRDVLPDVRRRGERTGQRRLSIWSAGCSTGEEVYTLAMLIDEAGGFRDWDVRIFGSDIARSVIQVARAATYRGASFRAMPEAYGRYFRDVAGGREVRADLRARCRFGQLNLLDADRVAMVGRVDVVFCKNVLIYFDLPSRRRVIDLFYERLVPGGLLFLGHAESLLNVTTAFEMAHLEGDLAYRRPFVDRPPMPEGR